MLNTALLIVALTPTQPVGEQLVEHAREVLGTPYHFGGRLGALGGEGIDCQGVLFYAAERVGRRCGWRSYSVMPTKAIPRGELGRAIGPPFKTSELDLKKLKPGDILWLVGRDENPAEPHIALLDDEKVWVWHTGMYSGEGRFVVGDHYAGQAVEEALAPYLERHKDMYQGLIVTRMKSRPAPRRCRKHAPMTKNKALRAAGEKP